MESRDPANGDQRRDVKLDCIPVAPLPLLDRPYLPPERDTDGVSPDALELDRDGEVGDAPFPVAPRERIAGAVDDRTAPSGGIQGETGDLSPHLGVGRPRGVGREIGKRAHGASDVGNPEPGEEYAGL